MIILTEELTKFYGRERGVRGVNLEVREGEVFGFLGPNGAGKTTTIRILLDFIRADSGSALLFGMDSRFSSRRIKSRIGYLPGEYGMYENMTGAEYLRFIASLRGGRRSMREKLVESLGFDPSKRIKSYSHGTKQKLAIVQAFMHDPELLILDEPTSGLDPLVQHAFYDVLADEKRRGKTVFMSSHVLSEVERVCDRVAILKEGAVIAVHDVSEIKKYRLKTIEVEFTEELDESIFRLEGVRRVEKKGKTFRLQLDSNINGALSVIAAHHVENLSFRDATLEDVFMEYY
ncbi:MAG: ABC transporter ATP-binding protein [bacterium]